MKKNSVPFPAKSPSPGPDQPRRGDIWRVRLDPTLGSEIKKTRLCLVVTTDTLNRMSRTIVVVPLSTLPQAAPPVLVRVTCSGRPAVAVTDQIRAVSRERLLERLDTLSAAELIEVEDGLREVLEL